MWDKGMGRGIKIHNYTFIYMHWKVDGPIYVLREAFKKKNYDYSDIVPISFYTHPPERDRDGQ